MKPIDLPLLYFLLLVGCSSETQTTPTVSPPSPPMGADGGAPLSAERVDVYALGGPELSKEFPPLDFDWFGPLVDWDSLTPQERSNAMIGGGLVAETSFTGHTRISESYRGANDLKMRWQEKKRGDGWIHHGPEISWESSGEYELLFRVNGEVQGPVISFDSEGVEVSREMWKDGMPVEDK